MPQFAQSDVLTIVHAFGPHRAVEIQADAIHIVSLLQNLAFQKLERLPFHDAAGHCVRRDGRH